MLAMQICSGLAVIGEDQMAGQPISEVAAISGSSAASYDHHAQRHQEQHRPG